MSGAIPRSIPVRRPRRIATVRVRALGPSLRPSPAGDVVWVTAGPAPLAVGVDARTGERRATIAAPDPRSPPADAISRPVVSADGTVALLVRREDRVSLLLAEAGTGVARVVEPARPEMDSSFELDDPVPGPGGSWIVGFDSRRIEALRPAGGLLWSVDGARLLGAARGIVLARRDDHVDDLVGLRAGTGERVWAFAGGRAAHVALFGDRVIVVDREGRTRERERRRYGFARVRAERIARDPVGARQVDWGNELERYHRELGRYPDAPVRGFDVLTATPRFRFELPGDAVPPMLGGPHVVCVVGVDEEGVGGVFRHTAADGARLGHRGFHLDDVFRDAPASLSLMPEIPSLAALDHTHLLWIDGGRELVCEVLADPGHEVWRVALSPLGDPRARAIAAGGGRIFVRDPETLEIWAADDD